MFFSKNGPIRRFKNIQNRFFAKSFFLKSWGKAFLQKSFIKRISFFHYKKFFEMPRAVSTRLDIKCHIWREFLQQNYSSTTSKVLQWAENTNIRGSITVQLTSCLFCLDSAALLMLNEQQFFLLGQTQTSSTGGQRYSDTLPLKVSVLCTWTSVSADFDTTWVFFKLLFVTITRFME